VLWRPAGVSLFKLANLSDSGVEISIPSRWDDRYRNKTAPTEPSKLLIEFANSLPNVGWALDLACGGGRNSIYLARRGMRVLGVDRSWNSLERGRALASQKGATVLWLQADLEQVVFPAATFDVILCFYYRDPLWYGRLCDWLRPGGLLMYETYTQEQLRFDSGPRNPAHLLHPGELLEAFREWRVVLSRETIGDRAVASLVARKPDLE
jgi:tellurite methyltransferase